MSTPDAVQVMLDGDDGGGQPRWLTAEETAAILRVHISTVHDMCRRGQLVTMKAGRDWRISAAALREKELLGDVHIKLVHDIAELSAQKTATLVMERLAGAIGQDVVHSRIEKATE